MRIPAPGIADTLPRWRWEESGRRLHDRESAEYARAVNAQAVLLSSMGRWDEALPKFREALAMRRNLFAGDHSDVAESLNDVAAGARAGRSLSPVSNLAR